MWTFAKRTTLFLAGAALSYPAFAAPTGATERADTSPSATLERATTFHRKGDYRQAVTAYEQLLSLPETGRDVELHAYVLGEIADVDNELGDYQEAQAKASDAITLLRQMRMTQNRLYAFAGRMLAHALQAQGYDLRAKEVVEEAVAVGRQAFGPDAPEFSFLLSDQCQIMKDLGKLDSAEDLCEGSLQILQRVNPPDRFNLGTAYQDLAVIKAWKGRLKEALAMADLALATWNEILPADHPSIVYALDTEMVVYTKLRNFRQADELAPRILALCKSPLGAGLPARVFLLNDTATLFVAEKQYAKAEPLLRQAVADSERYFKIGHPTTSGVLSNYANVLAQLGRKGEAARVKAESGIIRAGTVNTLNP
jgi:tetratricopeptide (TPR) repeat protein